MLASYQRTLSNFSAWLRVRFEQRNLPCSVPLVSVSSSANPFSYSAEIRRKTLHLLALVIPFGMWWLGTPLALYSVGALTVVAVVADLIRAYSSSFNDWIRWIFGPLMRDEELPMVGERITFNGATCVLIGAFLLILLFPLRVAVPVLTMTMLADAAAALVGRRWGRHRWGPLPATVEGTAAFILTGLVVMIWFPFLPLGPAIASVIVAAIVEAAPLPVNDNIRVPITAALVVVLSESLVFGPAFFTLLPA